MFKNKKININGSKILNTLLPVILAFVIGGIIIALIGENPIEVYKILFGKSLFTSKGFSNTLHHASPLIITALAIAVTFKADIFNMGVEGQFVLGGFFAGIAGFMLPIESPIMLKIACIVIGAIFGILFALVPAILKAYFHVDELVITLTLNYAIVKVLEYLSSGPFRADGAGYVATPMINENAMFQRLGDGYITMFFIVSIVVLILIAFVLKKTKLGYEITAIGKNPDFAEATGMRVRRKIIILMCLSGALAGIAGAGHMMSQEFRYTLSFSGATGIGWDGMLIALMGRHSPAGILVGSIFYSALQTGADSINIYTSVPKEIVGVLQSLIILFIAIQFLDERYGLRQKFMLWKAERGVAQ